MAILLNGNLVVSFSIKLGDGDGKNFWLKSSIFKVVDKYLEEFRNS